MTDQTEVLETESLARPDTIREVLTAPLPPLTIGPYKFWPPVLPAPMCGISDRPWRVFAREQGCPLVYTQMVSCEAMTRAGQDKSWALLDMYLERGPVCAQVFGGDPDHLADTARMLQDGGATIVDLNMGCPVNKVVKANGGSALMTQPALVREIFKKMRAALTIPFTVKFRAGWEKYGEEAFAIAQIAADEGLDALCIHARTRQQGFKGVADWTIIGELKKRVPLPVIGNGDVKSANDAVRMVRDFGADAVMVGRAGMGNPWLFGQIVARFKGEPDPPEPTVDDRLDMVLRHAEMMAMRKGENIGLREFRKHVVSYMKTFPYAREMKQQLMGALTMQEYRDIIERGRGLIRERGTEAAENPAECAEPDCGE